MTRRAEAFKTIGEGNILGGGASLITAAVLGKDALEDHSNVKGRIWNDRLGLQKESYRGGDQEDLANYSCQGVETFTRQKKKKR